MQRNTYIVIHLDKNCFRLDKEKGNDKHSLREDAAFLFDKAGNIKATGKKAREEYKNPGFFTRKKNLTLLDFDWIKKSKINDINEGLPCPDDKSLCAVDAFASILSKLYELASKLSNEDKGTEVRKITVCVAKGYPFYSIETMKEALQKSQMRTNEVTFMQDTDAVCYSFAQSVDMAKKSEIKDGLGQQGSASCTTDDCFIIASINEDSTDFYFYKKGSDQRFHEDKTKKTTETTLSRRVIQQCLQTLLTVCFGTQKMQRYPDDMGKLIKELSVTNLKHTEGIKVPDFINEDRNVDFSFDQVSLAFASVEEAIRDLMSSSSKHITDVIVLGDFQCLLGLDIKDIRIHTQIDVVSGCLARARNGPLMNSSWQIHLRINKDMTYSYEYRSPKAVVLETDRRLDSQTLEAMPISEKDGIWSESQLIHLKDNRPYLRFHQYCQIVEPIFVSFELLELCGIQDKIFQVLIWNKCWTKIELVPKENVLEFELPLDATFYVTSMSKVTEKVLTPTEGYVYEGKDEMCTVNFGAGCIAEETKIECKVIGIKQEKMKYTDNLSILSITKGIHVHMGNCHQFNKAVDVQLPFVTFIDQKDEENSEESANELVFFEINDDGDLSFLDYSDTDFAVKNGCIQFQATCFSSKGAAYIRSESRISALSQISKCYNIKHGHRILTLVRINKPDIDVWFAIFETDKYDESRERYVQQKRAENFREITASHTAEVFLRDGWTLRFFITSGAKNISHEYHRFISGSEHNIKLLKIRPTQQRGNFAECRVLKRNDRGKHEELLVFPFDIAHALPPVRKPRGFSSREPSIEYPYDLVSGISGLSNRPVQQPFREAPLPHPGNQGWLNDRILLELACRLHKEDIWVLGIMLELNDHVLHRIEEQCGHDITRYAFNVLKTLKTGKRSQQPENHQVKFLREQLEEIDRNDLAHALQDGFYRRKGKLFND